MAFSINQRPTRLLAFLLLLLTGTTSAESLYVIDRLQIGLHVDRQPNSAIIKLLTTGTKLEVLQSDDELVEVRDPDGNQGWVDARFVTAQLAVDGSNHDFRKNITAVQSDLQAARLTIADLKLQLVKARKQISVATEAAQASAAQLAAAPTAAPATQTSSSESSITASSIQTWHIVLLVTLLVAGFVGGIALSDWLNRRRHGGFRV